MIVGGMPSPTMSRRSFQTGEQTPQFQQPSMVQSTGAPLQPATSFDQGVSTGGMSISDAFDGLSTTSGDVHHSSLPAYVPQQTSPKPSIPEEPISQPYMQQAAQPAPVPAYVAPPTPATRKPATSYDMGDTNEDLGQLKLVLQKLTAENISLKAQLGNMSEEEKDVHKELSAAVKDIGKLSSDLHTLRASVLAAKTRLMEASAELKAAKMKTYPKTLTSAWHVCWC
jgi:hypothetical protein